MLGPTDTKSPMTSLVIEGYRQLMVSLMKQDFRVPTAASNYDASFVNDLQQKAHVILQAESDTRRSDRLESAQQHEHNMIQSVTSFLQKIWLQILQYKTGTKVSETQSM